MIQKYSISKTFRKKSTIKTNFLFIVLLLVFGFSALAQTSDLSITKEIEGTDTPNVGDRVTFVIKVTNIGPNIATGVDITDILPSGYGKIVNVSNGNNDDRTVVWENRTIAVNSTLELRVSAEVLPEGDYNNRAQITASDNNDPNSDPSSGFDDDDLNDNISDDDESDFVIVKPRIADLSIEKTAEFTNPNLLDRQGRPYRGSETIFTLTVTNPGPSDANNVQVTDQIPEGFIYVSDNSSGSYNETSGVWNIGTIVSNASESIEITTVASTRGEYTNTATITNSDMFDPDVNNNTSSVTIDIAGIFVPETFTPNNDGVNDEFVIPGIGRLFPNYKMEVYNRWGSKVYEYSNDGRGVPDWWDGTSDGKLTLGKSEGLPTGTYYYIIYFNQDNLEPKSDWVYLNR